MVALLASALNSRDHDEAAVVECRFISGLQHSFQSWQKPFNPILGETFQADLSDGSTVAMEQISHHPPVSAFQLFGPGKLQVSDSMANLGTHVSTHLGLWVMLVFLLVRGSPSSEPQDLNYRIPASSWEDMHSTDQETQTKRPLLEPDCLSSCLCVIQQCVKSILLNADGIYEFSGLSQPDVSFELKANAVKTQAKGKRRIIFKDGTKIEIEYPTYHMRGDHCAPPYLCTGGSVN